MTQNTSNRVLIVGWDGADWRILEPMLRKGQLPALGRLISEGVSGPLRSTIPTHSYTAWASFMTGKNPGKHGIYAFMSRRDPAHGGRALTIDRRSIVGESFIEALARHGRTVGTAHVPLTFPPVPLNGFWISGMVIPEGATYTHPPELQPLIEGYAGSAFGEDVLWNRIPGNWERLFDISETVAEAHARGFLYLLDRLAWDVFTYVFVSPDRLQHVVMRLLDESHPEYDAELSQRYMPRVVEHFQMLDRALGEAVARVGEDTLVLLISDHGFRACWRDWSAADWLRQRGYLRVRRDWRKLRQLLRKPVQALVHSPEKREAMATLGSRLLRDDLDWKRTQAYVASVSEHGIRVNLEGREPLGVVPQSRYEEFRKQMRAEILALRDPDSGEPLVREVYMREELFYGDKLGDAPDLVFELATGIGAPSTPSGNSHVMPSGWKSGEHDPEGILVAHGPHVPRGRRLANAHLIDIAPTVLHVMGVPIPDDMDGVFLEGMFAGADFDPIQFETPWAAEVEQGIYSDEEQDLIEDHLRSLGYLD